MAIEQSADNDKPDLSDRLWQDLLVEVQKDPGEAARAHLQAGRPIYYSEDDTPEGLLIKKYPDGRKELVKLTSAREEIIRTL
ncbi:hypothetical protein RZA67_14090 [Stenotrophomonas sp. C3(2023)]|uniref:hypothetical protein n=1 Tax=Stenotrophomonas sp. C3(2023) TaxID=3080277 RepID=UPI00293C6CA9|nr:hypothetical protein [Stenotrophomonas sp. C3(2023)]MDV3469851.1 hypothetical protein [Stenotrophomonas sp. C3(2023)]